MTGPWRLFLDQHDHAVYGPRAEPTRKPSRVHSNTSAPKRSRRSRAAGKNAAASPSHAHPQQVRAYYKIPGIRPFLQSRRSGLHSRARTR